MPDPSVLEIEVSSTLRADLVLLAELKSRGIDISRARLKALFKDEKVFLRNQRIPASHILSPGRHTLTVHHDFSSSPVEIAPSARGSFLPVVFEDSELLVLNKASGVPSLPHSAQETETAIGSALAHFPGLRAVNPKRSLEPGLLHRLDTGTSGLLALAKTAESYDRIHRAWKTGGVRKIYRAICAPSSGASLSPSGASLPELPAELFLYLAHDAKSVKRMVVYDPKKRQEIRGRPLEARTRILAARPINSLERAQDTPEKAQVTLKMARDLEIEIHTGVMHQIRCTLASLGWPVLGDPIYRGSPSSRLWLHAWKLEIPLSGDTTLVVETALPPNWPL